LPPNAERLAVVGEPIAISTELGQPLDIATNPEVIQLRRIARLFFLPPDTAATIARLHFGEARA
jgi:hypothetical protein